MQKFKEGDRVTVIPVSTNTSIYNFNGTVTGYHFNKALVVFDESSTGFPFELEERKLKLLEE